MPAILRTDRVCESRADVACILRGSSNYTRGDGDGSSGEHSNGEHSDAGVEMKFTDILGKRFPSPLQAPPPPLPALVAPLIAVAPPSDAFTTGNVMTLVYAVFTNSSGQVSELSVSLKSMVANIGPPLPTQSSLVRVLVVCDQPGSEAVRVELAHALGDTLQMPLGSLSKVDVDVLVVSAPKLVNWERRLSAVVSPFRLARRHTFGTFVRLFLHEVIPPLTKVQDAFVIYADTDVVFLSDVRMLFEERLPGFAAQLGPSRCAALMLLNIARLPEVLKLLPEVVRQSKMMVPKDRRAFPAGIDDQQLLVGLESTNTSLIGNLSSEWDGHLLTHGMDRNSTFSFAALHFNGGGGNRKAWFQHNSWDWMWNFRGTDWINMPGYWRLGRFYADLPWSALRRHQMLLANARRENGWVRLKPKGEPSTQLIGSNHK